MEKVPLEARIRRVRIALAGLVGLLGLVVLVGWAIGPEDIVRLSPGLASMKPLTAVSFVGIGAGTALLPGDARRRREWVVLAGGIIPTIVGAVTVTEHVLDRTLLGFDRVIFGASLVAEPGPDRMSLATAVALLLLGLGLIAASLSGRAGAAVPVTAGAAGLVGYVACLGYLYGVRSLYQVDAYTTTALHTGIGVIVASAALLLAVPGRAPVALFCDPGGAGRLTRRLAPAVFVAMPVVGWLTLDGLRAGLYDPTFEAALMAMSLVAIFGALNWSADRAIMRSEEALVQANQALEGRVAERTAALAASQERFRAVATSALDAIVATDAAGEIVYANPAAAEMFGPITDGLVGRPVTDLIPARYCDAYRQALARYLAAGVERPGVIEVMARRAGGEEFPVELSLSTWEKAERRFFAGIARDVTDKHRAEAARQEAAMAEMLAAEACRAAAAATDVVSAVKAFAEVVSTGTPVDGVSLAVHDGDGAVRVVGVWGAPGWPDPDGQRSGLGDGPHWAAYRQGGTVAVADTTDSAAGRFDRQLAERGILSYVTVPIVAGADVWGLVTFAAGRRDAFPPARVALCERCVRAATGAFNIVLLLDRERRAAEQLRVLDRLRNDFVGILAHDLRSPIAVISGLARIVRQDWTSLSEADRDQLLDRIASNSDRLSDLAGDVLDVARIESGTMHYEATPFDVVDLVHRTVTEITTAADRRSQLTVADDVPPALGDEAKTWRVLANLISNALKFSPPDAPITVDVATRDGEVRVSVTDHGPGFSPADHDRLFQRFSRVTVPGAGPKPAGTGLGLYIAKNLIEGQHGRIWARSTPGGGATFGFTLPTASLSVGAAGPTRR